MEDDETEMEKILVELSKFEPSKQTEDDVEEDEDFIIDPDIQGILDEMDSKLSEVFDGFNQQYEDIADKLDFITNILGEYDADEDESGEEEAGEEEWKELEVEAPENSSNESSEESLQEESSQEIASKEADTETSQDPESEPEHDKEVTHESVIRTMSDTVINPLCSKYGEDLRQSLETAACKLVDCGDEDVINAYLKKFASAIRSSKGSKKQIQKYINEIKKLPTQGSTSAE